MRGIVSSGLEGVSKAAPLVAAFEPSPGVRGPQRTVIKYITCGAGDSDRLRAAKFKMRDDMRAAV